MFLTFAQDGRGRWVGIDDANRGKTQLLCPYCKTPLIAKKGTIKQHHFAHDGETCLISQAAVEATQIPLWDTFELLDADERKYLERRQKYLHDDIYYWPGMRDAMDRLETMGILLVESTAGSALKKSIRQLKRLKSGYLDQDDRPTPKLWELFDAVKPLADIERLWYQATTITDTQISRAYHANKLGKQKTVRALEKAQRYWFDAFCRRQALQAPAYLELLNRKLLALNDQKLYVMCFTGSFESAIPGELIKIGYTAREPDQRIQEVKRMLRPFGKHIKGKVVTVTEHLGRLERLIHLFYRDRLVSVGTHREFFDASLQSGLIEQLEKIKAEPYCPPDVVQKAVAESPAPGRKKKSPRDLIADYPDVVKALDLQNGAIRATARATGRSVNTVQKVKAAVNTINNNKSN